MADLDQLSVPLRLFLRSYPWRRIDPVPWTHFDKPLSESRLALVSSAGFIAPGQEPFDPSVRGGDSSFREIPHDIDPGSLINTHRSDSFDHGAVESDPNLAFPLERVREMAAEGRLGEVNRRHLSFMGSITATRRLIRHSAPAMAETLAGDAVDLALLVPV